MLSISLYEQVNHIENADATSDISNNSINDRSSVVYNEIARLVLDNYLKKGDNCDSTRDQTIPNGVNDQEDGEEGENAFRDIPDSSNNNFIHKAKTYFLSFGILFFHISALIGFRKISYYFIN